MFDTIRAGVDDLGSGTNLSVLIQQFVRWSYRVDSPLLNGPPDENLSRLAGMLLGQMLSNI
jgi:hypothetical protein